MRKILVLFILFVLTETIFACTMFTATKNGKTLVGNNEDHRWQDSRINFVKGNSEEYGYIYFSHASLPGMQGGMNEKGLICDIFSAPAKPISYNEKIISDAHLLDSIMKKCESIEQVINILNTNELKFMKWTQLMFVDKSGNSVIVEGDDLVYKNGDYQIVTNFYQSEINKEEEIKCERYKIASKMIDTCEVTISNFRKILSATHAEGSEAGTLYSNIYDPNNLLIYLYHHHNYENVLVVDLKEELKKEERSIRIKNLFPPTFAAINFEKESVKPDLRATLFQLYKDEGLSNMLETFKTKKEGIDKLFKIYKSQQKIFKEYELGYGDNINSKTLNWIGLMMLDSDSIQDAITIFKFNTELYPNKPAAWNNLGKVYMQREEYEKALFFFKKVIELDPDDTNAKKSIKEIETN